MAILIGCEAQRAPAPEAAAPDTGASDTTTPETPAPETAAPGSTALDRPAEMTDTLYLEGTAEPVTLRLYDEPGVPFTTYVPADMEATSTPSADSADVRFYANFGGYENPDAYLGFTFPAGDVQIEHILANRGWQVTETYPGGAGPCAWAAAAYRFEAPGTVIGHVCAGTHAGRPFYLTFHIPAEYADGFSPRAALILDAFRWRDTNAPLR